MGLTEREAACCISVRSCLTGGRRAKRILILSVSGAPCERTMSAALKANAAVDLPKSFGHLLRTSLDVLVRLTLDVRNPSALEELCHPQADPRIALGGQHRAISLQRCQRLRLRMFTPSSLIRRHQLPRLPG